MPQANEHHIPHSESSLEAENSIGMFPERNRQNALNQMDKLFAYHLHCRN